MCVPTLAPLECRQRHRDPLYLAEAADRIVPVCAGRLGAAVVATGEAICCDSSAGPADPAGIDPPHAANVIKKEAGVATRTRMPLLSPALP
jgi:hypothetical protein